jgi:hypothetical protein
VPQVRAALFRANLDEILCRILQKQSSVVRKNLVLPSDKAKATPCLRCLCGENALLPQLSSEVVKDSAFNLLVKSLPHDQGIRVS